MLLCSSLWLSGCSLTSGFNDFKFHAADAAAADGGSTAGAAGSSGGGVRAGAGGSGGAVPAGAGGGAGTVAKGGSGGASGADSTPTCQRDSDCADAQTFHCVNQHCALRRVPSAVWPSAGGGISQSAKFVVRVSAGAPQPMGISKSANYTITVGPGAGRP
jgi:hypothetical protein